MENDVTKTFQQYLADALGQEFNKYDIWHMTLFEFFEAGYEAGYNSGSDCGML
jgi:hypothetical protein